jgi:ubiquinone/menaquinone biosynthesis C-methylase UbiE
MAQRPAAYIGITPAGGDTATPLNLRKRLTFLQRHGAVPGARLLDGGCGAGDYVVALRQLGVEARGVEYQPDKVGEARRRGVPAEWIHQGDLEHLDFPDRSFDLALLNEVLEHVPDETRVLDEMHRVLIPGGTLVVLSPNRLYPFETHGVTLRGSGRRVPHYLPLIPYIPLRLGRKAFDYWARNYWPGELSRLVSQSGFHIVSTEYLWQTFENISGRQPPLIKVLRPLLRAVATLGERMPGLRCFGVSQALVAIKRGDGRTIGARITTGVQPSAPTAR